MKTAISTNPRLKSKQGGAALLIAMLVVVLGLVTLLTFRSDRKGPELEAERKTALALAQAKEALLGRAATDGNRPGSLPCPDTDDDGQAQGGGVCPSYVGRLPWKSLDLPDLRDGHGERLWYKLSTNFRDHNSITINTTTAGTLSISGTNAANGLAAIIFSPGAPSGNQVRDAAHKNDFAAYLEGYGSAADLNFNNAPGGATNDRLLTIAPAELMNKAVPRLAAELRGELSDPYSMMAPILFGWPVDNGWAFNYTRLSDISARVTFDAGCASVYEFTWDSVQEVTIMRRIGNC